MLAAFELTRFIKIDMFFGLLFSVAQPIVSKKNYESRNVKGKIAKDFQFLCFKKKSKLFESQSNRAADYSLNK